VPAPGRAPTDHRIGIRLWQHCARELTGAVADRAEQRPVGIATKAGTIERGQDLFLEVVMAGHRVALSALLAQPHPSAPVLRVDILDRHAERGADRGE
jgi:hypothetical protein